MKTTIAFILSSVAILTSVRAFESDNLIVNGKFNEFNDKGYPVGWENISHPNHLKKCEVTIEMQSEGENSYLHIDKQNPEGAGLGDQKVTLPPNAKQVRVACRIRSKDFVAGQTGWQVPSLSLGWIMPGEERPIGTGNWLLLKTPADGWQDLETVLPKPEGAVGIKVSIGGIGWTGSMELDDVVVEPLDE